MGPIRAFLLAMFACCAMAQYTPPSGGGSAGVSSFNTRTGAVTLSSGDVTTALGFTPAGLGANTFTGRQINSTNGAASAPVDSLTGTWFSGGSGTTTKPQDLIECNSGTTTSTGWNTAGTGLGINGCSGFTGSLLELQLNGVSVTKFNASGTAVSLNWQAGNSFQVTNKSFLTSATDGLWQMTNAAFTGFTRLNFGGGTSSFGGIGVTNQANPIILIRDASGGNTASLDAGLSFSASGAVAVGSLPSCAAGTLYNHRSVTDSMVATPGSAAVGGGTFSITVQCIENSSGSTFTWIVD